VKNFKKILIVLLVILSTLSFSQQEQHYTQFQFNKYMINPGVAGTEPYFLAKSNFRFQWLKIVDSPKTYTLSVYGPHKNKPMGFGGYVFNDVTGPTSRTALHLSYAYNFQISDGMRMSMGLSGGLQQFKIDGSKITLHDDNDPSLSDAIYSSIIPDANFGVYFYGDNYNFGIAGHQLLNSRINFSNLDALGINRVRPHVYAHGQYLYQIDEDWAVEPAILLKYMWPTPIQMDLSARAIWKEMIWAGITWRTYDAVGFYIGYNYQEQIYIGYAYDYITSNLTNYSTGTHEIMITARFNKIKKGSSSL